MPLRHLKFFLRGNLSFNEFFCHWRRQNRACYGRSKFYNCSVTWVQNVEAQRHVLLRDQISNRFCQIDRFHYFRKNVESNRKLDQRFGSYLLTYCQQTAVFA